MCPPDVIHMIIIPRPSLFFATLPPCVLNTIRNTQEEAWEREATSLPLLAPGAELA